MNNSLEKFIKLTFKKSGKALDLGAGKFFDVACMKQLGWKCEGVDINTGIDLELPFLSVNKPFDLVYSNYVIQKLNNKKQLLTTAYENLKDGGWFFLHTFDVSDKTSKSNPPRLSKKTTTDMMTEIGFKNISFKIFSFYDNDTGHKHWHKILEIVSQK